MTRQDLVNRILGLMIDDIELLKKKNSDYSPGDDALENFRDFGVNGVIVRIGDKYKRLKTFAKRGAYEIKEEGVRDTLQDLSVYSYIARVLHEEE